MKTLKTIFTLLALVAVAGCQPKADADKAAATEAAAPEAAAEAAAPAAMLPPDHMKMGAATPDLENIEVPKASGPDARTVEEVITKRNELVNKTVVVRGKVVKFSPDILKKNWIHLRDGSGSSADETNDVLVTTTDQATVGDVVLVKGVVHVDQDLGMGYAYNVLIEEATLQKQ